LAGSLERAVEPFKNVIVIRLLISSKRYRIISVKSMTMNESDLPSDFAERVIELESLLDDNFSMELIQDLNELYRVTLPVK
jgi:hypothetical protein